MNANFEMAYLEGGDDVFGPNLGGATVHTNVRKGYVGRVPECRQAGLQSQVHLKMENEIMGAILNDGTDPEKAATNWLKANPGVMDAWLDGVTTLTVVTPWRRRNPQSSKSDCPELTFCYPVLPERQNRVALFSAPLFTRAPAVQHPQTGFHGLTSWTRSALFSKTTKFCLANGARNFSPG